MNTHYDSIDIRELTSSVSHSNSEYLEPFQGESSSSADQSHDYCELVTGLEDSNITETQNAPTDMPETNVARNAHPDMPESNITRDVHLGLPESVA